LLDACRLTRLNQHYRPTLQLCQMFLDGLGPLLEPGAVRAPAFFFPMELLFQEAVGSIVQSGLPAVSRQSRYVDQPIFGSPNNSLSCTPDIVIGNPPVAVVDT